MRPLSSPPSQHIHWGLGTVAAIYLLHLSRVLGWWHLPEVASVSSGLLYVPVVLGAAAIMWEVARHTAQPRVWRLLSLGTLLWGVGQIVFAVLQLFSGVFSAADPFFLALPACFLLAFLALERQEPSLVGREVWLDVAALVVSVGAFLWYFLLAAQLLNSPNDLLSNAVTVAYPLSDLLLLTLLLARAWRGAARDWGQGRWVQGQWPQHERPIGWSRLDWDWTLALGMACFIAADLGYSFLTLKDAYTGQQWPDTLWPLATLLFAVAAVQASRGQTNRTQTSRQPSLTPAAAALPEAPLRMGLRTLIAPYAALGSSFALLLTLQELRSAQAQGVLVATFVVALLVAARQTLALRELESQRTKLEESRTQLHHQAHHDPLTGLGNRAQFDSLLPHLLAAGNPVGVLFIDLDDFKFVNDALGHRMGDQLLKEVAGRLQLAAGLDAAQAVTHCIRFGGDEFLVLTTPASTEHLHALGARLLNTLRDPVILAGQTLHVTACLGGVLSGPDATNAETLLRRADLAMYAAKRSGKNAVRLYTPGRHDHLAARRVLLETRLRGALERAEFRLFYQPQQERGGQIRRFEALLRWDDAELGSVAPGEFIPVAESAGLMIDIGNWVIEEACRQLAEWRHTQPERRVAINIDPPHLMRPDFLPRLQAILTRYGLPGTALELEVTERLLIADDDQARETLRALLELGIDVAVDDFGVGQSSLAALLKLPITTLKIDRAFISELGPAVLGKETEEGLHGQQAAYKVVQAVVALGAALGLRVVAEGVETPAQAQAVWVLGCDAIQGYLVGRAVPPEQIPVPLGVQPSAAEPLPLMPGNRWGKLG
ncbi:bifunctional diguanylate cyclase/phosphodiesterase [Deinococcus sp. Arct2-2]|uniref:putative bifunctional diguanylate cyclase/phosphodiesterase n=1 Tax=Deinococcus sp. Arct2-2 TaxID=2568653 RepID=UPI0010A5389D|nr:bifunctional diguanylate cyclase/phosphodiesterase [Deinococcus sp. Arct2-2]THF71087.1 bifunctional diguanylate cyclase/phosphodiesterase [Deinococcus sp. Arct2-2]